MIKEGFLLDADYITEDGKAIIRLWCTSEKDDFVVLDRDFEPYFYALPPFDFDRFKYLEHVKGVEEVEKKKFGVPIDVYKVFVEHPSNVPSLREELRDEGVDVREADVLFAVRYIIDKELVPLDGIRVEGKRINGRIVVSSIEHLLRNEYPELRVMAFDCEMAAPGRMPLPEKDPVVIISVATNDGKKKLFKMDDGNDDSIVITGFLEFLREYDPHIIVGYNSDAFDWPYLISRAKKHGIALSVGKDGSQPKYDDARKTVKVAGRLNVDLYRVAARDLDAVKVKKLENVADYLDVMSKEERVNLSPAEITQYWNSEEDKREILYEYALDDAVSTIGIAAKLLPIQYELTRMVRYPLDDTSKMGRGRMVESFLSAEAYKSNELVPPKRGKKESYAGGFVLDPKEGLHENVACLDFSSMYPSIMVSFNISPDTIAHGESDGGFHVAPEVGHMFLKHPDGFFKRILSSLIERRKTIKGKMARCNEQERKILDIEQKGIKILTNAFYGYTGWSAARWYRRECAEATAAWGRYFIKTAIEKATTLGLEVIYGDTDSVFVKMEGNRSELIDKAERIADEISRELPLELAIDDIYDVIFFTDKKKRYAGLTQEGEIVVRGLEIRRGDWCELAKELQSGVIRIILQEKNPGKAMDFVKGVILKIERGEIPLEELVIYKTLTKRIQSYESQQAHVVAAKRAVEKGITYDVGSKVPYVILRDNKANMSVSDRAHPAELVSKNDIDYDYYIHHQIIPVSMRILKHFGYSESNLLGSEQQTLDKWF
jgi:DNA polymerase I